MGREVQERWEVCGYWWSGPDLEDLGARDVRELAEGPVLRHSV